MVTIRLEKPSDAAAREALLDLAYGPVRFEKPSERLRAGRTPARGLSFVAVEDGRVVGTVRLWDVAAGPGLPRAAARAARGRSGAPPPRHRLGADAACAARPPPGAAIAPCCWSATRRTTAASASRPSGPPGCGCRALPTGAACSACELAPARSTACAARSARRASRRGRRWSPRSRPRPARAEGRIAAQPHKIVDAARDSARRLFRPSALADMTPVLPE